MNHLIEKQVDLLLFGLFLQLLTLRFYKKKRVLARFLYKFCSFLTFRVPNSNKKGANLHLCIL